MVEFDDNFNPVEPTPPTPPTPPAPEIPRPEPNSKSSRPFPLLSIVGLVLLALVIVAVVFGFLQFGNNPKTPMTGQPEGLSVSGDATVYATPDVAKVSLGITKTGKTVAEVKDALAKVTDSITAAIKDQDIEDKDIQTTNLNIYPQYSRSGNTQITGYTGDHTITITVRDLDKVDTLTDSAVKAGANKVSNVSFTVEDPEKWWQEARTEALAEAKEKAKQMAKDADIRLGRIISINEWSNQPYPLDGSGYGGMEIKPTSDTASIGIQPGNLELQVNVSLIYQIR
jgi:uncharacterized protein